jgi:hypothetical protein
MIFNHAFGIIFVLSNDRCYIMEKVFSWQYNLYEYEDPINYLVIINQADGRYEKFMMKKN